MLLKGNCLDTLKTLPDNSIDSVVTDPPYELGFMGKSWDASGIAYNVAVWQECLRVLKPGGHLLAFGGTRTYHRIAVAIEDAGFEVRDSIHWTYGSGFPKSYNVAKGIEGTLLNGSASWNDFHKLNGEIREVQGGTNNMITANAEQGNRPTDYQSHGSLDLEPTTDEAKKWMGWGTALKPSHEPIIVARKPLEGTVARNVLAWGVGGINIDATRVGTSGENFDNLKGRPIAKLSTRRDGETDEEYNARILESPEQQEALAKLKELGRFPANTLFTHASECQKVGEDSEIVGGGAKASSGFVNGYEHDGFVGQNITTEVWECVDGCPVKLLDEQSGLRTAGHWTKTTTAGFGEFGGGKSTYEGVGRKSEKGGASRYFTQTQYDDEVDFPPFVYMAKASKSDKNAGLGKLDGRAVHRYGAGVGEGKDPDAPAVEKNFHPTVKPVALMQYLIRLVTPSGGKVLDPFLGSGTTAVAAILEGCDWVGCELTADYWAIIDARVTWAKDKVGASATLF